jgi:hypothetical protein
MIFTSRELISITSLRESITMIKTPEAETLVVHPIEDYTNVIDHVREILIRTRHHYKIIHLLVGLEPEEYHRTQGENY